MKLTTMEESTLNIIREIEIIKNNIESGKWVATTLIASETSPPIKGNQLLDIIEVKIHLFVKK